MNDFTEQFINDCLVTESCDLEKIKERFNNNDVKRNILFYLQEYIDLVGKLDIIKKFLFYGKETEDTRDILFTGNPSGIELDEIDLSEKNIRLFHAALGIATESGEFIEPISYAIYDDSGLDEVNLNEELADFLWYLSIALNTLEQSSYKPSMDKVIAKLKARYGDKFTEAAAINRNLELERKVLENE